MISRRKTFYPISDSLRNYLAHYGRLSEVPLVYDELLRFTGSIPYENPEGEETLWLEVMYPPEVMQELRPKLTKIYAMLKIGGDLSLAEHLTVERIDFGEFGNSRTFRIRITNQFNGNSDYYYEACRCLPPLRAGNRAHPFAQPHQLPRQWKHLDRGAYCRSSRRCFYP